MDFDLEQTDRLLLTTKQVRKRMDMSRPVPRETLLECIDIASRAPMGSNQERNKWMIVEENDLKASIAELYRKHFDRYFDAGIALQSGDARGERVASSAKYLSDHMHEVPAIVIPLRLDRVENASQGEQAGFYGSVLPGAWSFQMALRSRGIGSCWTTLHLGSEAEVGELLGIPDTVTQAVLMPVGYYSGDSFAVTPRRPASDITFINQWGNKAADL